MFTGNIHVSDFVLLSEWIFLSLVLKVCPKRITPLFWALHTAITSLRINELSSLWIMILWSNEMQTKFNNGRALFLLYIQSHTVYRTNLSVACNNQNIGIFPCKKPTAIVFNLQEASPFSYQCLLCLRHQLLAQDNICKQQLQVVNGLNPGVSVSCLVWSSRWG